MKRTYGIKFYVVLVFSMQIMLKPIKTEYYDDNGYSNNTGPFFGGCYWLRKAYSHLKFFIIGFHSYAIPIQNVNEKIQHVANT